MLCRPFGDLSRWAVLCLTYYVMCRPIMVNTLGRVWLCYVGPLVTLAVFGYVM